MPRRIKAKRSRNAFHQLDAAQQQLWKLKLCKGCNRQRFILCVHLSLYVCSLCLPYPCIHVNVRFVLRPRNNIWTFLHHAGHICNAFCDCGPVNGRAVAAALLLLLANNQ